MGIGRDTPLCESNVADVHHLVQKASKARFQQPDLMLFAGSFYQLVSYGAARMRDNPNVTARRTIDVVAERGYRRQN